MCRQPHKRSKLNLKSLHLFNPVYSMTQPPISANEQMQTPTPSERVQLRRQLLQSRHATPLATRQGWDKLIAERLYTQVLTMHSQRLAVYWPIKAEPDLQACYQELSQSGVQLALPLVVGKDQALRFIPWAPGDAMDIDDWGIAIPRQRDQEIAVDTLLIPCVGFNTERFRLGYGGGYYDRSLALMPQANTIGVAYQQAQINFSSEHYDIAMHCIITETGMI